ncbi:MAG: ImmA/IrrE family metallo-endopeptidase [Candidatus Liptonbacteria bacterium]|nr:ImmA/IrrE family metallo-endopeptidase [Candidatus Liptonbacteria bacterium]
MADLRFEPVVLKWAREKRFGPKMEILLANWVESWKEVTPDLIKEWENGIAQPTFAQVRKLAEIYKRPLAVFFLDGPPKEKKDPPDLRTINSEDNKLLSPAALLAIRKARRVQEVSADLHEELGERPFFKYARHSLDENASELAENIRADLLISANEQFGFKKYEDFFEYLRNKIESAGVITLKSGLHDSFPITDCRAFSFADQQPYLVFVNNKDTEGAKNFSLAHEFAHVLLREAGICNNFKSFSGHKNGINKLEVFCNQFAASFLVPEAEFLKHRTLKDKTKISPEDLDSKIERIAFDFKVSRVVILRRLLTFNYVTSAIYEAKTKKWDGEPRPNGKKGGRFSLKTILSKNGVGFSSLVFEAYKQKKIPYSGISDYLGLKMKHLPGLEKLIHSHAR